MTPYKLLTTLIKLNEVHLGFYVPLVPGSALPRWLSSLNCPAQSLCWFFSTW